MKIFQGTDILYAKAYEGYPSAFFSEWHGDFPAFEIFASTPEQTFKSMGLYSVSSLFPFRITLKIRVHSCFSPLTDNFDRNFFSLRLYFLSHACRMWAVEQFI